MKPISFFLVAAAMLPAQSIQYSEARKVWLLTTRQSSYAMGVGHDGALRNLYWGAPLWRLDDVAAPAERRDISSFDPRQMLENEEYPGWGGTRYYEPALKITRADGDRDLVLHYASHRIHDNDLDIILKDIRDPIEVTLHYRVYPDYGIIRRSATIRNGTANPFTVESAQSATWYLPPGDGYQLTYLSGRWAAETQINHEPIHEGEEGAGEPQGPHQPQFQPVVRHRRRRRRRGITAASGSARWPGAATGASPWSRRPIGRCASPAASTPSISPIRSSPARSLDTPAFFAGYSQSGFGGASRTHAPLRARADSPRRRARRACARCSTTPGKPPPST